MSTPNNKKKGGHTVATVALLLNASFEPLKVVSAKRAVILVISSKAEIVEPGDARYRHEHGEVVVPSVLRLVKFVGGQLVRRWCNR
jgi:hypothetical protein